MKYEPTIKAMIDMKAYKEWYQTNARCGVWLAPENARNVLVSEPFRFEGENEDYREVVWLKNSVCASVPARFITVKS